MGTTTSSKVSTFRVSTMTHNVTLMRHMLSRLCAQTAGQGSQTMGFNFIAYLQVKYQHSFKSYTCGFDSLGVTHKCSSFHSSLFPLRIVCGRLCGAAPRT